MEMKIIKPGEALEDAFLVRREVFVIEQGFSSTSEYDDIDHTAYHLVYYNEGQPIATCRFFLKDAENAVWQMGRVAVLKQYRKTGLGHIMLRDMEDEARRLGALSFWLSAQTTVRGFYEKAGYVVCGEEYLDEHCPHIPMSKKL